MNVVAAAMGGYCRNAAALYSSGNINVYIYIYIHILIFIL